MDSDLNILHAKVSYPISMYIFLYLSHLERHNVAHKKSETSYGDHNLNNNVSSEDL